MTLSIAANILPYYRLVYQLWDDSPAWRARDKARRDGYNPAPSHNEPFAFR